MKYVSFLNLLSITAVTAFSPFPSSFTGRATSVCTREELTTGYTCVPSSSSLGRKGSNMGMPPFLKKLGLKKPGSDDNQEDSDTTTAVITADEGGEIKEEEELTETEKLLKQVKEAGTAGVVSYALWELAFWALSVPVCISAYYELFGHFPDFTDKEDLSKLGGEAFAFVNFARFAVPLRIGLALSTTKWIQENVVDKFGKKDEDDSEN
jgi:hypothetical protein